MKASPIRDLDKIDRKILEIMQQDGRITMTDLAPMIGLSVTPCTERVRRLERDGIISGYHARLNPHALGLTALVFMEIRLASKSESAFREVHETIHSIPDVLECHMVSSDFDYLLKARLQHIGDYRKLVGSILERLPAAESRSYVVTEELKETLQLTT